MGAVGICSKETTNVCAQASAQAAINSSEGFRAPDSMFAIRFGLLCRRAARAAWVSPARFLSAFRRARMLFVVLTRPTSPTEPSEKWNET